MLHHYCITFSEPELKLFRNVILYTSDIKTHVPNNTPNSFFISRFSTAHFSKAQIKIFKYIIMKSHIRFALLQFFYASVENFNVTIRDFDIKVSYILSGNHPICPYKC